MLKYLAASFAFAAGIFFGALPAVFATPALPVINTNHVVVVTDVAYGAVGDNATDNTSAIQAAIIAAAAGGSTNGAAGGLVKIPAGNFLCGPITLLSSVNLQVDAGAVLRMLPFGRYPLTYFTNVAPSYVTNGAVVTTNFTTNVTWTAANFITANSQHDIAITGPGAIDGQGLPWWPYASTNGDVRPVMLRLSSCNRELIQNITLSNSPMFHISVSGSSAANTTVSGVVIRAPSSSANPPSHNTDACDVAGTSILVQNCDISVGDDDFTCGGGTSDVLITNNVYGSGHGLSIGSYTDGGVQNFTVVNCTFNGTDNGIRIKSDNDRGGLVQNINYYNIGMTNVHFPIQIYGYYTLVGTPSGISPGYAAARPVDAITNKTPIFRNITFSNITATSVSGYPIGVIWACTEMPATNIVFNKVNLTGNRNFDLYNVSGAKFIDCNLNVAATTNTFALFNAQVIITNSTPTNRLYSFDGLTTNGYGNSLAFYNASGSLKNTNAFDDGPLTLAGSAFTVSNNLTLFPNAVLNFTLGTNATKLAVVGNLLLGGTNNIFAGAGFTNGIFTVMTYTGTLSGSVPVLGSVPPGYNLAFDTSTFGQVKLVVTTGVSPPLAPANLSAVATNALVTLTWSPSATATNYNVKRALVSGGSYAPFASTAGTNFSDVLVTNGVTYFYVVSAVNANGEGLNSAEVNATPTAPQANGPTVIFNDTFAASALNSAAPALPSASSTSYEIISSKSWNPFPTIAAGHLDFGIGTTTSGSIEVQALFAATPVKLATIGDSLTLTVTFINASGLLTQNSALGFGLYRSGQNFPVPGGLNGTATTSVSGNAAGNAQAWLGYVGQLAFTGASSQILTRPVQTISTNNDQDLVTSGSGSSSYNTPVGATIGAASSAASLTLAAGSAYTEVLSLKLAATNVLAITNSFYGGTDTNGTLLSQFGGSASGSTFLTNSFDALAIGWRATANTTVTTMDVNKISVSASLASAPVVSLVPTNLVAQVNGNRLQLSWPADHLGWRLQIQTNNLSQGVGTNWISVPNSTNVVQTSIVINPANDAVFLRLVYP